MSYDGSIIIRDQNNNPIPQQWDDENQEWKAYGEIPTEVKQTGSIVEREYLIEHDTYDVHSLETLVDWNEWNSISTDRAIEPKKGSKGLIITLIVTNIDGDIEKEDGLYLSFGPNYYKHRTRSTVYWVDFDTSITSENVDERPFMQSIIFSPSIDFHDLKRFDTDRGEIKKIGLNIQSFRSYFIEILSRGDADYNSIDFEILLTWLY